MNWVADTKECDISDTPHLNSGLVLVGYLFILKLYSRLVDKFEEKTLILRPFLLKQK